MTDQKLRMTYLGIDPGASGGLAALHPDGHIHFIPTPKEEQKLWKWFADEVALSDRGTVRAVIERVGGYVGRPQSGSMMFHFGQSYGFLRACLIGNGFQEGTTFESISPQTWQRTLGLTARGKNPRQSDNQWKNQLRQRALYLFPQLKITLATADALLIAHYCRFLYGGGL